MAVTTTIDMHSVVSLSVLITTTSQASRTIRRTSSANGRYSLGITYQIVSPITMYCYINNLLNPFTSGRADHFPELQEERSYIPCIQAHRDSEDELNTANMRDIITHYIEQVWRTSLFRGSTCILS